VADRRALLILAAGATAGAVLWLTRDTRAPAVTFMDGAFDQAWSPYSHFQHSSPKAWVRAYPATVAPNCLPMPYQNQDVGLAVKSRPLISQEVSDAACAQ
jgi:uncharacterized membrane protein